MILDLNYKYGHGHMTVDLDKFLPASLPQWRKLVQVMADSSQDQYEEVKDYLTKRFEDAKKSMALFEISYVINSSTQALNVDIANRLRKARDTHKRGSEKSKELSKKVKDADALARYAGANVRDAVAKGKVLKKYVDKYPDYMRMLWE